VYSALSLGFRLPARIILIPQTQFDYIRSRFVMIKVEAEKQMFTHGVLKLTYEHNFAVNIRNIQVGFRYDFSFAQTGLTATNGHDGTTIVETARGSLLFDRKTHWIGAENLTSVGKGGIVIQPFLDLNNNGRRDMDEPKVIGLTIHMSGGHITQSIRDSSVRVSDLEPFTSYFIDIDRASFENVAWQIRKPLISVAVDPNQFKLVEIPVSVFGEVSGMVYLAGENGNAGQGRVIVSFYRSDSTLAGRTLTEADGYYNFLGLGPGSYVVRVDEAQLHKLNLVANPGTISFGIARSIDGDQAMGLDFILRPNPDGNKGLPADDNGNR
ncbi:MAG: hypothetical protein WCK34_14000, partial [Bacteroidota bacterium]